MSEIEKVIRFRVDDGKEFDTKEEAQKYLEGQTIANALARHMEVDAPDFFDYETVARWLVENYEIIVRR